MGKLAGIITLALVFLACVAITGVLIEEKNPAAVLFALAAILFARLVWVYSTRCRNENW